MKYLKEFQVRKIFLEDYEMFQDKDWILEGEITLPVFATAEK